MFIEVAGIGKIRIESMAQESEGLIRLYSKSGFCELWEKTIFPVEKAFLFYNEENPGWTLFTQSRIPPECEILLDDCQIFQLKNQAEAYRLKAFL